MSNLYEQVTSYRKRKYKRVVRNDYSYHQTDEYTIAELERQLELYHACIEEDQRARLIRDCIDHHVRRHHDYCISGRIGGHYRQYGVDESNCVFEHILPTTYVVGMLIEGRLTVNQALNTPTCLITKEDDVALRNNGLASSTPDNWHFFDRYKILNTKFKTWNGIDIKDPHNWTLETHFKFFNIT